MLKMVRTWMYTYYMVQKKGYDDYLHGNHQKIIKKTKFILIDILFNWFYFIVCLLHQTDSV